MAVPSAQLRIFVPRDTLDDRDAARWTQPLGRSAATTLQQQVVEARAVGRRVGVDDAAVLARRVGDVELVCPLQHDLRCGLALRELEQEVPEVVLRAMFPDPGLRDHVELAAAGGRRPHIVDVPWAVPLTWLALFDPTDHRLLDPAEGAGPRLLHATTIGAAMPRLLRVIDVVDGRIPDADDLLESLADVAGWVDGFDPRSLVELDHSSLGVLLGPDVLARERDCHELWLVVEALEEGQDVEAVARYTSLNARWRRRRTLLDAS